MATGKGPEFLQVLLLLSVLGPVHHSGMQLRAYIKIATITDRLSNAMNIQGQGQPSADLALVHRARRAFMTPSVTPPTCAFV